MKKRIIAMTLCFVMLMTVVPMAVSAQTPQSIEILDLGTKIYGDKPFKVSVTADAASNLTDFTYESSNTDVAEIGADGTVTIKAAGETIITARQAGNSTYAPAEASRTLTVNKKDIVLSSLDIDNRKAEFVGILDEDADKVALDFDKLNLEVLDDKTPDGVEDILVQQGYVKIRGIVTENAYTDIDAAKTIDTSEDEAVEIVISDAFDTANKDFLADEDGNYELRDYLVGTTNAADYLGMSVIAYVNKNANDKYEIFSITEDTARNNVLEIDLTQFNKINAQCKFEYYKTADAKTATAVVIEEDVVVFNNTGGYDMDDIFGVEVLEDGATLNGGKITLIDNDTINGYDVIFVEIAETAVVDEATDDYVAFKEETSVTGLMDLVIDEDDENVVISITKDGEAVEAADLEEWDVLSIIANADESYIKAEVISNQIVGIVKSVYKSDTSAIGYAYTINGTKYDVAAGAYGISDLGLGEGGTFYIDKYGKIAAFNEDAALASGVVANYAYVTAAAIDTDLLTGENTAIVQMVTAEGVVALNIKSTNAKVNDVTFDADDYTSSTLEALLKNKVVKYTKDSSDKIKSIITADADADITAAITSDTALAYDADNGKFSAGPYLDSDAIVFFIDASEATDSFVGTTADLEDEVTYTVYGLYADDKADDNNILVVAVASAISPKANMGVLTAVGTSANDDGEEIYSVEVLVNGETIVADTTADVYDWVWGDLTVGDIVKIKTDKDGLISSLEIVYDFVEDVRDLSTPFAGVTATEVVSSADYVGGKVTNYKKSSTLATVADNNGDQTIKLSQAQNVIVIDANGRNLEISKGSASNFKAYEYLYDTTLATVNVTIDKVAMGKKTLAEAQKAADYVYARKYDGKVIDLVIVKGAADMRVTAGEAATIVDATMAWGTFYGKDAYELGNFDVEVSDRTITVTGTANYIDDYTGYDDTDPAGYFVPLEFYGLYGVDVEITYCDGETEYLGTLSDDSLSIVFKLNGTDALLNAGGTAYTIVFDVATYSSYYSLNTMSIDDDAATLSSYYSLNTMSIDDTAVSLYTASNEVVVNVTNLTLIGEKAENYNLTTAALYSTFNPENMVTLTLRADNGTITGTEAKTYLIGLNVSLTAVPDLGYTFKGWYKEDSCVCTEENYEFVLSADTELSALFERKEPINCGTDENGIDWYLYEDGTLELEGKGKMYDYSSTAIIPWYSARTSITEILIGDGITHIGDRSFYNCISAKKVIIPESVTSIGTYAFKNCDLITVYGIPESYAETYADENGIPFAEYDKTETLNEISVDMTENDLKWYFDISANGITDAANAYAAIYNESDRMLSASSEILLTDDLTTISVPKHDDAAYAKIFILKTDVAPAAISKQIDFE